MKTLSILTAAIAAVFICGCSTVRPFEPGPATSPPIGCQELRERRGEC